MDVLLIVPGGGEVATVRILPFQILPEVLLWGLRVFISAGTVTQDGRPIYREARGYSTVLE